MPKKIPIRIYRIRGDVKNGLGEVVFKPPRPDSNYLQNVTASDITPGDTISITPADVPGNDIVTGEYPVIDRHGTPYIIIGTTPFYIRLSDIGAVAGEVLETFEFYINPQRVSPTYRKLNTEVRTRGGWEIQHWGSVLTEIHVDGKSGGMNRATRSQGAEIPGGLGQSLRADETVMDSDAWKRLSDLRRFYDKDHNVKNQEDLVLLAMNYYDRYYIGYFTDFSGPAADAQNPYQVNYTFTFKVQQEISVGNV